MHSHVWRTTVLRRIASAAVAGAALLAAFGCGSGGNDASVSARTARHQSIAPAAEGDVSSTVNAAGLRTVTYQGVQFDVPADWPVHDLAADPTGADHTGGLALDEERPIGPMIELAGFAIDRRMVEAHREMQDAGHGIFRDRQRICHAA